MDDQCHNSRWGDVIDGACEVMLSWGDSTDDVEHLESHFLGGFAMFRDPHDQCEHDLIRPRQEGVALSIRRIG